MPKHCLIFLLFFVYLLIPSVSLAVPDPVLSFTFDNVDDIVQDLSGNGNDGELEGEPQVIDGQYGDALEFQNSRVKILASDSLHSELFADGSFTLVLWINAPLAGNAWQQVFRAGPDPNDTLFLNVNGTLSWRGWVGAAWGGGMCETAAGLVQAGEWTHVAVVSDGTNFQVYHNGEMVQESNFQQTRGNNQEFMIGGYAGGESYTGAVDELAIFAEPLSEADINSIMNKGLQASTVVEARDKITTTWAEIK
ncbi:hypothetical protein GF312_19660 [Candidatus Poribacteria bacterium]|nr:hypothetical protein [Candidatus Poribacteria bacterium]